MNCGGGVVADTSEYQHWELLPGFFIAAGSASPLCPALNQVFGAFLRPPSHHDPGGQRVCLDLPCVEGLGAGRVWADGQPIFSIPAPASLAPYLEISLNGLAIQQRGDRMAFHAAATVVNGQTVWMVGNKGSGKSTLALCLAQSGACYGGDELVFARLDDGSLEAYPKAVTIKQASFPLFQARPVWQSEQRGPLSYHAVAEAIQPGVRLPPPGLIVVPDFSPRHPAAPHVIRLAPPETAVVLQQQCLGGLNRDPRALALIARWSGVPACLMEYSDSRAAAATILKLCAA